MIDHAELFTKFALEVIPFIICSRRIVLVICVCVIILFSCLIIYYTDLHKNRSLFVLCVDISSNIV